jgi:hypothetical protein
VGADYPLLGGNQLGPTAQAFSQILAADPGAYWDPTTNAVAGTTGDWRVSPRVLRVPLFDPAQIAPLQAGAAAVRFNRIGLFFLEAFDGRAGRATLRFIEIAL